MNYQTIFNFSVAVVILALAYMVRLEAQNLNAYIDIAEEHKANILAYIDEFKGEYTEYAELNNKAIKQLYEQWSIFK